MENDKHTPGPWKYSPYHRAVLQDKRSIDGCCLTVCYMPETAGHKHKPPGYDETARLIAAAPDLLDALRKSADRIDQLAGMVNSYATQLGLGQKIHAEDWGDVARAAIAKATGEA